MNIDPRNIDRRIVYLLVILALSIPLIQGYTLKPARMQAAESFYQEVEKLTLNPGQFVFLSLDFGPNSKAENLPQSEVVIEHLMRRRIPLAVYSQYNQAEPFLNSIPEGVIERLQAEDSSQQYIYGRDWVNLGFRPGGSIIIQGIADSKNLAEFLKKDARGNSLKDLPIFSETKDLSSVSMLVQITSLVGTLDTYLQFFSKKNFRPIFGHGCTSITIPQAFNYLDSGQLRGLLEGIAGAAWYSQLLKQAYPARKVDSSMTINTGLGIAHLVVILLVVLGNLGHFIRSRAA
ncbi:MAG: hypothetical protein DCC75_07890 [Proteobacteria bacterium]|nr:MAG: hypothetical protein DCC75_07890 [Pseudomonadota bacterium]